MFILAADVFEAVWPFLLDEKKLGAWTPLGVACFAIPIMYLLDEAMKRGLPPTTVYAFFVGIGLVGNTIVGILFFRQPMDFLKSLFILLILVGAVGLKLITTTNA